MVFLPFLVDADELDQLRASEDFPTLEISFLVMIQKNITPNVRHAEVIV